MWPLAIVVILLLLLVYFLWYRYSQWNTFQVSPCALSGNGEECSLRNVHREHHNPKEAAKLIEEITRRNRKLMKHLRKKYLSDGSSGVDPARKNRIDNIGTSFMYDMRNQSGLSIMQEEAIQECVTQLVQRYSSQNIYEISPLNKSGVTSFTEDKKILILCLRKKEANAQGEHELHDVNTMMFVVLHELAHMMNKLWGHQEYFWVLFKFLLENACEIDIYQPVNYQKEPIVYCGLRLTYNPLYDDNLALLDRGAEHGHAH